MSEASINILMTGAGAPGAPGIIQCLKQSGRIKLTVGDANKEATGKFLVTDFVLLPKGDDPAFADELLRICYEKKIKLVLPLVTKELFTLSAHQEIFLQNNIKILVSPFEALQIANNKSACYDYLLKKGIAVPAFRTVKTVEEFIHAAFELGHPQNSFCFKPSLSNGSRGFRIVSDSLDESKLLFEEKPYQNRITYAHALKILSSAGFPELLVSEYLPGEEYSVDCLANQGKPVVVVPRLRKKMIQGISVQGEFVQDEKVIRYCETIIKAIGLHGNIGIQVKYSAASEPLLVEINPRVQGTIVAGLGAGINLPLLGVKQELGIPLDKAELKVKWGTRFSRYWTEVYY